MKLTKLEMTHLTAIDTQLTDANDLLDRHSDSINDLLYSQIDITVAPEDKKAFDQAISALQHITATTQDLQNKIRLLHQHFSAHEKD